MLYYMQVPYDALHIQLERWLSWSKAHDWKSCIRGTVSRVRIPFSPPKKHRDFDTMRIEATVFSVRAAASLFIKQADTNGSGIPALYFPG